MSLVPKARRQRESAFGRPRPKAQCCAAADGDRARAATVYLRPTWAVRRVAGVSCSVVVFGRKGADDEVLRSVGGVGTDGYHQYGHVNALQLLERSNRKMRYDREDVRAQGRVSSGEVG